ncbi:hypothetical protein [Piscinibacter gummiphilus]|uniref:Uncharacterized protein n=1 Tax=Piscinibacter gummiphilus TaxID=946333 RepID=A0ABZ0D6H6_9BURK|nr:hypothetical protein [Piscinibacter gummiphilus]WOB11126.1 hypothetical protein RXV79_27185 [Piscinibacter gummiphilus]
MKRSSLAVLLLTLHAFAWPQATDRAPVTDSISLMLSAFDTPDGSAKGILVGKLAQDVAAKYGPSDAILIDVSTVRRLPQEGCRLLNVKFEQVRGKRPGDKRRSTTSVIEIGLCRDGTQPADYVRSVSQQPKPSPKE